MKSEFHRELVASELTAIHPHTDTSNNKHSQVNILHGSTHCCVILQVRGLVIGVTMYPTTFIPGFEHFHDIHISTGKVFFDTFFGCGI
jgi:uncharacterized membrane protein